MGTTLIKYFLEILLFVALATPSFCTGNKTFNIVRLPTDILPTKYFLHIRSCIHQGNLTFNGNVTIDLAVYNSTDQIVLHSKKLRNFNITLTDLSNKNLYQNIKFTSENETDFLRIFPPIILQKEVNYRLEILFTGDIREDDIGFYKDSYKDDNNRTINIGTTNFEAINARLAFPCFDEPSFKSKFQISITHGKNFSAISNMPADGEPISSLDNEMLTTKFLETPVMSTYLIAFVISNYRHIKNVVKGIEYRVFTPDNSKENGTGALKNAIKSVDLIGNYFGIDYPLPKLDLICVEKHWADAMENWGLITVANRYFLLSEERGNKNETLYTIYLQTHEIIHNWFGNLITPKWWSNVWLKEGFATYFAFIISDLMYPDYNFKEYFIADTDNELKSGIGNAMSVKIEEEKDILDAFGINSYSFAARVIGMFHHAIGDKTFIKGIKLFLSRNQYSVVDEDDLYKSLQDAIDEDEVHIFRNHPGVGVMMRSWSHNIGFPNITLIRNYDNGTITICQHKDPNKRWWIPLSFATAVDPNFEKTIADFILPPEHKTVINLKDLNISLSNSDWLIVNKQQTGIFGVVYDTRNLELIAEALNTNHTKINIFNRAQLFRDLYQSIERFNYESVSQVLPILQYLQFEEEALPWIYATELINNINWYSNGEVYRRFNVFTRDIIKKYFRKLFFTFMPLHTVTEVQARYRIIREACKAGLRDCLILTYLFTEEYIFNQEKYKEVDEYLEYAVICQGLKSTSLDEFKKLVLKISTFDSVKSTFINFIYALACIRSNENIEYGLNAFFGDESKIKMTTEFKKEILEYIFYENDLSRDLIRKFLDNNMKILFKDPNHVSINGTTNEVLDAKEEVIQDWIQDQGIEALNTDRNKFGNETERTMKLWLRNYKKNNHQRIQPKTIFQPVRQN